MATRDEILRFLIEVAGEQDLEGLSAALSAVGAQAKTSESEAAKLAGELDKLTTAARGSAEFVRLKATLNETADSLRDAKRGLEALNTEFSAADRSSAAVSKQFRRAEEEVARLTKAQNLAAVELQRVTNELQKAGVNVDQLADEERRLREEAAAASRELQTQSQRLEFNREAAARNAKALDAMGDAFQRIRANLTSVGGQLLKVGAAATTAAAAFAAYKTGQFFGDAITDAREFGRAISEVAAVSGATGDELEQLRQVAITAAKDAGFTFVEAAGGLGELARATGDAQTAIASLPAVLNLARAGGLEVARAAEIATTTLTQFGLSAEESGRIADVLARAANSTTSSVEQLGNSLSYAAPLARQLGLGLEPTVAIIGALADQGFRGERAGTALRNVFSALADPTSAFSRALADAGIESRDFTTVIEQLGARADGGRKVFLALDAEARPALLALARDGGAAIRGLTTDLQNSAGQASATAKVIKSDLEGAFGAVRLEFQDLQQKLVEPLLEPLQKELVTLSGELREFAASPEFEKIRSSLVEVFQAGITAAREFAGQVDFKDVADRIATFASGAKTSFAGLVEDVRGVAAAIIDVVDAVSVVVNALQTGILALATAVTGLAAAGQQLVAFQADVLSSIPAVSLLADVLGVDLAEAATTAEERAKALQAVTEEFWSRTKANARETSDAINEFGEAMPAAAEKTAPAAAAIVDSSAAVTDAAAATVDALNEVPAAAEAAGGAVEAAAGNIEGASERIERTTETVRQRLVRLQQELEAVRVKLATAINSGASEAEIEALEAEFDRLSAAVQRTEGQLQKAGLALESTGASASNAAAGVARVTDAASASEPSLRSFAAELDNTAFAFGAVSQQALEALFAMNEYAGQGSIWVERVNSVSQAIRAQRESLSLLTQQLDEQLARFDPLQERLQQLKRDYSLLDEAQLREIAQKQEQLAREEERLARESERVQQETSRSQQRSNAGAASGSTAPRPSGGGASAAGPVSINVNIEGLIGDVDRGALEQFARQIKPILDRIARNSQ